MSKSDLTSEATLNISLPVLALDIGGKRIGVAVSDRLGFSCRGVTCLFRNDQGWTRQVAKLITEYGSKAIVVGLPKNMDGTEGGQAQDCRNAAQELAKVIDLPIVFQDERLSTWTARERLFAQGLNEKKVRAKLDQTSAAVFLEDFIAAHPHLSSKTEQKHA
ncbi:MAG: Holliday junction resolvase RuvX [Mariprofundaceae bacterium]|nr:Holliday junction resolvase RuvX [Mariprofundaceae bacterium]